MTYYADVTGRRVAELLERSGQSQRKLAGAIGSTSATISNLVNGRCDGVEWPLIVAIANHFDVTIDSLATGPQHHRTGKSLYRELCDRDFNP